MKTEHGYGWLPDLPDQRDYTFTAVRRKTPKAVDLTTTMVMSAVRDQGNLGSCTGFGVSDVLMHNLINNQVGNSMTAQALATTKDPFSPLFVYYQERVIEGTVKSDNGAFIRDGIKAIAQYGAPHESLYPYDVSKFAKKPGIKVYQQALRFKSVKYMRIDNTKLNDLVACLAAGYPIVHGFTVYESFESLKVEKTGMVPMPGLKEKTIGGHCTVIYAWDPNKGFFCKNSWTADWGIKGYYWIPTAYLTDSSLADDFWCTEMIL